MTDEWKSHPVQGLHLCTDGEEFIYLLYVPEDTDYRYQVIEFTLDGTRSTPLETSGIPPKQRKPPLSCLYFQRCIYFWGGMQIFRGDATGSFVYQLDLDSLMWTNIEYEGLFPATLPHEPFVGCRFGHSTVQFDAQVLVFGGTAVEPWLVSPDCASSSVLNT